MTEISRDLYYAERAQDQANDDLDDASQNTDMTRRQVAEVKYIKKNPNPFPSADVFKHHLPAAFQMNNQLLNTQTKLMSRRPEDLSRKIREIQTKTDQNRQMATDAREAANAALQNATELEQVSGP